MSIVRYSVKLVLLDLVLDKGMMHIVWKRCITVDKLTGPAGTVISSVLFGLCSLPNPQVNTNFVYILLSNFLYCVISFLMPEMLEVCS